jgi:hypothetical protein
MRQLFNGTSCFYTIAFSALLVSSSWALDCTNLKPVDCYTQGVKQVEEAEGKFESLRSEISNLRDELRDARREIAALQRRPDVTKGLPSNSFEWVTGDVVRITGPFPTGGKLITAHATCRDGYVTTGGVCAGNPINVVHPMTAFEGRRTFMCNFHVVSTDLTDRTLTATTSCLKEQSSN